MKRTGSLIILFVTVFFATANCQQPLDSLLKANQSHTKEDSAKIILLSQIAQEYRKLKNTPQRFVYIEAALALGEKIKVLRPLPKLYNSCGLYYEGRSDFEKSIACYTRAIEISELFGDKENAAGYSLNFGTVYELLADYPRALALYQKAANYYIGTGKSGDLANSYVNIGGIYLEFSQQTEKSLEYLHKALDIFKKNEDNRGIAECYRSIGSAYLSASDSTLRALQVKPAEKYAISRKYYADAARIAEQTKDSSLRAEVHEDMGTVEEKQGNYNAAISEFKDAMQIYSNLDQNKYVAQQQLNLGRVYTKQNDFERGRYFLQLSLAGAKKMKVADMQSDAYFNLSSIYENLHNFDSAYFFYKQYIVMRDSVSNTEKQKEVTRKQLQFEFGIKEREYKLEQQLSGVKIEQQQQQLSLRNKQLELTNREKEIQKLNYLKKQSELEAAEKLKTAELQQKDLERKLATRISDQKIGEQQLQIRTDRKLTLFMGIALLIIAGASFWVYGAKQRTARLNTTVSAQKEELVEMGRVKDKIFSIVSHDMRAPVNNLVAFSAILEEGDIGQDRLALYLNQIKSTLAHTSALMENLLNWAASQMEGFTPVRVEVNLTPLVSNAIKGIEDDATKKKLVIVNHITGNTFVKGDPNMIELIIRNLLSNALKFSRNEGSIEIFAGEDIPGRISLSVKDTGVGISEAKVKLINALSVHTTESTHGTNKEKGTGLGLMLCKHFALLMKGNISVESKPEKGSTFTVSLPSV